jgi:hypothetical protein
MVTLFARVWLNLHGETPAPESWVGSHSDFNRGSHGILQTMDSKKRGMLLADFFDAVLLATTQKKENLWEKTSRSAAPGPPEAWSGKPVTLKPLYPSNHHQRRLSP